MNGFGSVFTNVRLPDTTRLELFDAANTSLGVYAAPVSGPGGLSFVGVVFDDGTRVARVRITSGTAALGPDTHDDDYASVNLVVVDDFIYGQPLALSSY